MPYTTRMTISVNAETRRNLGRIKDHLKASEIRPTTSEAFRLAVREAVQHLPSPQ